MTLLGVSVALLWVVVLVLAVLVFALARQVGVLHERVAPAGALAMNQRLAVGASAPVVKAARFGGGALTLGEPSPSGRSTLLFFVSPTCPVCKTLLPVVKSVAAREAGWLDVVFASDGDGHEAFVAEHGLGSHTYVVSRDLGLLYGVGKLPYGVVVDAAGEVASFGLVNTREHVESLIEAKELGAGSIQAYLGRSGPATSAPNDRRDSARTR